VSRVRRTIQWTAIGAIALFLVGTAYCSSLHLAEVGPALGPSHQLLTLLTLAIVVLSTGVVFVLVRNLVRLIVDRKRGILGAKLRTKLVFFFLALVLLPAFLLSFGAATFIKKTVEGLLHMPVEEVARQAKEIVKESGRREESRVVDHAKLLAGEIAQHPATLAGDGLAVALIQWRQREGFDLAAYVAADGRESIDAAAPAGGAPFDATLRSAAARIALTAARTNTTVFEPIPVGGAVVLFGAAPAERPGAARGAAVVGEIVQRATADRLQSIEAADRAYDEFRGKRRDLLRLYYSIICLVGLATVFVSSWIGFYVSRRITVPLEQVAAASREISQGNLGVRVAASMGDEVGMLVDAFNEMAGELQENREVITRGTADLRRTNRALEERRRYIETLVAHLSTAVLSIDGDGRVTTANPAVSKMLGLAVAPGDDLQAALNAGGLEPLASLLREMVEVSTRSLRREMVLEPSGARLTVSVQVSPLFGGQGDDLGTLLMVEDLTDLLAAQRAAAWREVARRIAHEIKNPLTPIQLAAQRLRKKFSERSEDLGEVVGDSTATIEREVAGLKKLVDEFSLYARMPSAAPEPVDFARVVESVVALYSVHTGIAWTLTLSPELGVVRVDPEQMRRALINLIDNAVAAMGGTGELAVTAEPYSVPGSLRVVVADRGPGIPVAARDHLFAPSYSTKPRGTGLGLAIVQRVVIEHGGTIRVEDNPGGGARFVMEIPGTARTGPVEAQAAVPSAEGGRHGA